MKKMLTATGRLVEVKRPTCPACGSGDIRGRRVRLLTKPTKPPIATFYVFTCKGCRLSWSQMGSPWWDEYYERAGFKFEDIRGA